jgi:3D-(3,5/4)-trihydroxycyclohexane-1,2-dione acylhydrolase (decyclizing)
MAAPEREVYVIVGDGSYLMLHSDLTTAIQLGIKITVVLIDNHGFASIGGLSESLGSGGFGTELRAHDSAEHLPVDFVANASSLGAHTLRARSIEELKAALTEARSQQRTTVIVVETDRDQRVGGYDSWWDVPVAEVSQMESVQRAREAFEAAMQRERCYHGEGGPGGDRA